MNTSNTRSGGIVLNPSTFATALLWMIARAVQAAPRRESLSLSPQTLSGQWQTLEVIGQCAIQARHRSLQLTEFGQTVFSYADDIFQTAQALTKSFQQRRGFVLSNLSVGVAASIIN